MKINCTYQKLVPVSQLVRHPQNANKHPEKQIQLLAKILKYQGWRHPIVVSDLSGHIVAGHGRLDAALLNGWSEVPVDVQKFDDKAQELAFLLADNLISELAETDKQQLDEIVIELGDSFDYENLGLTDSPLVSVGLDDINTNDKKDVEFEEDKLKHECPDCGFIWTE